MRFLLVDRLTELRPGEFARGLKAVSGSEDFFAEHFPGNPVMPGVLILEALAQTGGALLALSANFETLALMTLVESAKFRSHARPGDLLELEVTVNALDRVTARVSGRALVGGREIASAQIAYVLVPPERVVGERYLDFWQELVRALAAGVDARVAGGSA
ncbi:MAG TPA: 3-hydroxyacyl-ACP dehydratase FabZ [Longimicrobiales bacterium]|nr:3-hydroxyacyl-ACP dehydratase FabZ [Longimicrobiales bacterium]